MEFINIYIKDINFINIFKDTTNENNVHRVYKLCNNFIILNKLNINQFNQFH